MSSEEEMLGYVLKQAQLALARRMDEALRPLGLTVAQHAALNALDRMPGASNAELARMAFVTAQSMHGLLATLEAKGLVARTPSEEHGRVIEARLTGQGQALLPKGREAVATIEARLGAAMAPLDAATALALLRRCRDALA